MKKFADVVVWAFSATMLLVALGYVFVYGRNVPSWDEWDMVPTVTGVQPITWDWLWSQHNEHRIPAPRLVMIGVYRAFGDFRAGMYFNVLALGGATAWLLRVIARTRGRLVWTDIFLPLVALNLGQGLNFMWGWQIEFVLSTLFVVAMLALVGRVRTIGLREVAVVAVLMILLTGSGAHGLVLVPAMSLWMLGLPWCSHIAIAREERRARSIGWGVAVAGALLGAGLLAAYLHGYEKVPNHPSGSGIRSLFVTGIKAVTMSYGAAARTLWPGSALCAVAVAVLTMLKLTSVMRYQPDERVRAWGLLCVILAVGSLAAALGLGRDGFEPRYITLLFPLLWAVYLVWRLYGRDWLGMAIRVGMVAVGLLLLWPNTRRGLEYARDVSTELSDFEREMREGQPRSELIARHVRYLHPSPELLTDYLPLLRNAGWGAFKFLKDDPAFERVAVPVDAWTLGGGVSDGRVIRHQGQATLTLKTPTDRRLAGVEIRYGDSNGRGRKPLVRLDWRQANQPFGGDNWQHWSPTGDRANWERYSYLRLTGEEKPVCAWIWEKVAEIRIQPDYLPGVFELKEVTLLLVER